MNVVGMVAKVAMITLPREKCQSPSSCPVRDNTHSDSFIGVKR
jgi:hypothetical protein